MVVLELAGLNPRLGKRFVIGIPNDDPALGHRGRGRRRRCGSTPQTRVLLQHSSTRALQLLDPKICGCDIGRESTVPRDDEAPPLSQGGVRGRGVARGRVPGVPLAGQIGCDIASPRDALAQGGKRLSGCA